MDFHQTEFMNVIGWHQKQNVNYEDFDFLSILLFCESLFPSVFFFSLSANKLKFLTKEKLLFKIK